MEDETQVEETLEETVGDPAEEPVEVTEPEASEEEIPTESIPEEIPAETLPEETIMEETPVEDVPAEDPPVETTEPEDEVNTVEIFAEDVLETVAAGEEDLSSYRTISLTSIDVLETEQSGDVPSVMAEVIESVLGEYQRMTYTVEEYDAEGNLLGTSTEYVPGLAGLDYAWITGAILFALFIGGIFKLLGGLMRS